MKLHPVGNLTNIDYPSSTDVRFKYDWLNRVTNMVDAIGTTKYAYTSGGRLWTEDGPFATATLTNLYTSGLRTGLSLQQPSGFWTNRFGYDTSERLTNVTSSAGAFNYAYDPNRIALLTKLSLPNTAYITNTYENVARLSGTYLKSNNNGTIDSYAYVYNAASQRTNLTRFGGSTVAFNYDKLGQLKVADSSVPPEDRGYAYDTAWNVNFVTNSGVAGTFTVDSKNQLTSTPLGSASYDSNGNITFYVANYNSGSANRNCAYDDENRLTSVYGPNLYRADFGYDGLGRMRTKTNFTWNGTTWLPGPRQQYIYDGWRVIQERTNDVPTVSYTRGRDLSGSLEGAGGIGGLLARSHGYSAGNWSTHSFYFADGNGNIVRLLNSSQGVVATYRYDPFGNATSSGGALATANTYRFSSKEAQLADTQASPIYYYGHRFYDPILQRWLNRDPRAEWGGINLFQFSGNSPTGFVDPYGKALLSLLAGYGWSGDAADEFEASIGESMMEQASEMAEGAKSLFDPEAWCQLQNDLADRYTDMMLNYGEGGMYATALNDLTGGTQLMEALYGLDLRTARELTQEERWQRGLMGGGQMGLTAAGGANMLHGARGGLPGLGSRQKPAPDTIENYPAADPSIDQAAIQALSPNQSGPNILKLQTGPIPGRGLLGPPPPDPGRGPLGPPPTGGPFGPYSWN